MWTPEALLPPGPVKMMIIYTPPSSYCTCTWSCMITRIRSTTRLQYYTVIEATCHIQF